MKLCTFEIGGHFGSIDRLGIETPKGKILDLNSAYALTLAERDGHPRARVIADAVMPSNMLEFLQNEKHGPKAVNEVLDYLGGRIDDEGVLGVKGERLVWSMEAVRLLAPLPRPQSM